MKQFRHSIILVVLLLSLLLAACGGRTKETETQDQDPPSTGLAVGDVVMMGSYPTTAEGERETISWQVLRIDEGRALLISTASLDCVPFAKEEHEGQEYSWQSSHICAWLNGDFYDTAFTEEEKSRILNGGAEERAVIANKANPMTGLGVCTDTYDKVFLPSYEEVKDLFESDAARSAPATAYAQKQGVRVNDGKAAFWLRTMGSDPNRAAVVLYSGMIQYGGYHVILGAAGVRPCIWITAETQAAAPTLTPLSQAKVGDMVSFGQYEQDGDDENGKEDIVWRVLATENGRALLLSQKALDVQKYHAAYSQVKWTDSSLCKWLNSTFIRAAFTEEQQLSVVKADVPATQNPQSGLSTGEDSQNKVFVLSEAELISYLPQKQDRVAAATPYAVSRGASVDTYYGTCDYWVRNVGGEPQYAAYVYYYGDINYNGASSRSTFIAVRPAVWVELEGEN